MRLFLAASVMATFASAFRSPFQRSFARTGHALSSSTSSTLKMAQEPLTVGVFGGGVVGGGIVEILSSKAAKFEHITGRSIQVKKICVRDASKKRDFAIPEGCDVVTDYDSILNDDGIDVVVEVMGGTTDAKDVVYSAIKNKKHVVTANKALIADKLTEIEGLLNEVNEGEGEDTEFRYEAAVCGGIPVIRSMQSDLVGDDVQMLCGIINGCTNFMLTAMDTKGQSYDDALAEAGVLGYAEADPTLDVGGFDARSKLKILMRLAYGVNVDEEMISCRGITELTKVDFEYAKMLGGTIKLMGVAKKLEGDKVAAFVSPVYVNNEDPISAVDGATNAIEIKSDNLYSSTYIGQGAGRFPTANSCINDIVSLAKGDKTPLPFNEQSDTQYAEDFESVFYMRLTYNDAIGITRQCGEVCEKHGVSIHSILQNPKSGNDDDAFVIMTESVPLSSIKKVVAEIGQLGWSLGEPFFMPVLREELGSSSL